MRLHLKIRSKVAQFENNEIETQICQHDVVGCKILQQASVSMFYDLKCHFNMHIKHITNYIIREVKLFPYENSVGITKPRGFKLNIRHFILL